MLAKTALSDDADRPAIAVGVLIIDDQRAIREGLARLMSCVQIPLRCIATAANSAEALSVAALLRPEVIVLDVDLGGEDGLALIPQLSAIGGVLVLTSHGDSATRARAKLLGALDFIEKYQPADELLASVVRIAHLQTRQERAPGLPG